SDSGNGEPSTADVVENVTPLTTFIASESAVGRSRGTGWIYDAGQGYVVTNAHVVAGAGNQYRVGVTLQGGKQELRPAPLVAGRQQNESGTALQGQNYAIGTDRIKEIVPQLIQSRSNDCG